MSAVPQPSGKPITPPPAYSEYAEPQNQHLSTAQAAPGSSQSPVASPLAFPTHAAYYGPTPIAQQAQLLPYYDPRSPYAIAEATHRARWRFITAAVWAVAILSLVSFAMGWEVEVMMARGTRTGSRVFER
ncbi:hypothetical protein C8Q76DRAFT_718979 [Earliella scabrosa]|nr:hypothetical protein C8Q76DRAFT_718979 [Earliella scabrosa]